MKGWRGGASVLLWVSIFTSPAMPSHHCGPHNDCTPPHTSTARALQLAFGATRARIEPY